ncbi:MAG: hypothetical protein U0P81_15485 [Holophagaceae bacterium]
MLYAPLDDLPPLGVRGVLDALRELRRRHGAQGTPWATLVLRSGHEIRGRVIEVGEADGEPMAVLQLPDVGHEASRDAAYVRVAELAAVLVEEAKALLPVPDAEARQAREEAAASLMQLSDKAAEFGRRMSAAVGKEIPCRLDAEGQTMSPALLKAMAQAIEDTSAVLVQLAKDRFSRSVVQRSLREVHITLAGRVDATLEEGVLRVAGLREASPHQRRAIIEAIRKAM